MYLCYSFRTMFFCLLASGESTDGSLDVGAGGASLARSGIDTRLIKSAPNTGDHIATPSVASVVDRRHAGPAARPGQGHPQ